VTLQYLQTKFPYTRFTEKNKVWAKDVLFIMNFKCAPLRLLGGTRLHLKIYLNNQDEDKEPKEKIRAVSISFDHH